MDNKLLIIDNNINNIHNIINYLHENVLYNFITNESDLNNININDFTNIGIISNNTFNNISIDYINNTNYFNYFKFDFFYETDTYNIKYNKILDIPKPSVSCIGGLFKINTKLKCVIDENNGNIFVETDQLGIFTLNIIYEYINLEFSYNINITIIPQINYTSPIYNIFNDNTQLIKPSIIPHVNGIFSINNKDTSIDIRNDIYINKESGLITVKTFDNYNIQVSFIYNNLITSVDLTIIKSFYIEYEKTIYEVYYGDSFISDKPKNISKKHGVYMLNTNLPITIEPLTGVFKFNSLNVGLYNIEIKYYVYTIPIQIKVNTFFKYNDNLLVYGINNYTSLPIIRTTIKNYYFDCDENITNDGKIIITNKNVNTYSINVNLKSGNTIIATTTCSFTILPFINYDNKIIIKPEGGEIYLDNDNFEIHNNEINKKHILKTGNYDIIIFYKYNELINSKKINIISYPTIEYIYDTNILFNSIKALPKPIISDDNGIFYLNNSIDGIELNFLTGEIIFNDNILIGNYNFIVNYCVNNLISTFNLNFNIIPIFYYNIKPIIYGNTSYSSKPIINPTNGLFSTNFTNIDNDGVLCFNDLSVGNYNFNIIYTINNIKNTYNYNLLVKPDLQYINDKLIATPIGGEYKLNNLFNLFSIDTNTGFINVINSIVGNYLISTSYIYNNISTPLEFNYEIKPIVKYSSYDIIYSDDIYISDKPYINDIGGTFKCNNNIIIIDELTGIFKINNINIGLYKFIITYEKNNVKCELTFTLIKKPSMKYKKNNRMIYKSTYISEKPYIDQIGGQFITQSKEIFVNNSTGVITINKLDIGEYNFPVTYCFNNTFITDYFNICVEPIFNYENNILCIEPKGGVFSCSNPLIEINDKGIIDSEKFTDIGKFIIPLNYTVNNITTSYPYCLINLPEFEINEFNEFPYNTDIELSIKLINENGLLTCHDDLFTINNNKLINITLLNVDIYKIDINYELNGVINTKTIRIKILPIIYFNDIIIDSNILFTSEYPIIKPYDGLITCDNPTINIKNNLLLINPQKINFDNFNINYTVNYITVSQNIKIKTVPYISYNTKEIVIINYGEEYKTIKPTTNYIGGIYSIENILNDIYIDSNTGEIFFSNNLDYGLYNVLVNYNINNSLLKTTFKLAIYPTYYYPNINIYFGERNQLIKPIISNNINYKKTDFSIVESSNLITIDKFYGIIYIDDNIKIRDYNLKIKLTFNNLDIFTNIVISVLPFINYNSIYNIINYNENFISDIPVINPSYGEFKINPINDNIQIDEYGKIITNNLSVGIYNFNVEYNVYNQINKINYQINCLPIIKYEIQKIIINYGEENTSCIPFYEPKNGLFQLKNSVHGITILNNGQLIFDSFITIGEYNINVIYQLNSVITTSNYNIIVKPVIKYNDEVLIYNEILYSDLPINNTNYGYYELINNNNNNISINKDNGILTFNLLFPGIYIFTIRYTKNNISCETNLNLLIKPYLYYNTNNIITKYNTDLTLVPIVKPQNGIFNLDDGIIELKYLNVNKYTYNIIYKYNNIESNFDIDIIIESNIYYKEAIYYYGDENYLYPENYKQEGIFKLKDDTIIENGCINITNLDIGYYNYDIIYILNTVETIINVKYKILPKFNYLNSDIILYYGNEYNTNKPYINYIGDYEFIINDKRINIDNKTGIIYFDTTLKLGEYSLIVDCKLLNIIFSTELKVTILPTFIYKESKITKKFNENINIPKPFTNLLNGTIKCNNLPSTLFLHNDGSFSGTLPIGIYNLELEYNLNNHISTCNLELIILPDVYYNNYKIIKNYGEVVNTENAYINSTIDGIFIINDQRFSINETTGSILLNSDLPVDEYKLLITFKINDNIYKTFEYIIIVKPIINSSNNDYLFIYQEPSLINKPIVQPQNGIFKMELNDNSKLKYISFDNDIIINNLPVGVYTLKIVYIYNNQDCDIIYNIIIKPYINYENLKRQIIYNSDEISDLPILKPSNGKLEINNYINKNGQILYNNYKSLGNYNLEIKYEYNNLVSIFKTRFEIIPKIKYNKINYEMYETDILITDIPIIEPANLLFISELNINKQGQITFENYKVGKYEFIIMYGMSSFKIKLIVYPKIIYETMTISLKYDDEIFITPTIISPNGKFNCNDKNIIIDQETGIMKLIGSEIKKPNITIDYILYDLVTNYNFTIDIIPIINYSENTSISNYGIGNHSVKPSYLPEGGEFKIKQNIDNISIDNNGIIYYDNLNVDIYNLTIIYIINNKETETTYTIIINPICIYKKDIFYYKEDYKSNKPLLNPPNGKFILNLCKYNKINDEGIITLDPKMNVDTYNLQVTYIVNNVKITVQYDFDIIPLVFYYNTILNYNDNHIISAYVYPLGGIFSISNNKLIINNDGSILVKNMESNKYKIKVIYTYQNIDYIAKFKLLIKPFIKYKLNQLKYGPEHGLLEYNKDIISLENKQFKLLDHKIGKYNEIIKYTYNNISVKANLNIVVGIIQFYKESNIVLYFMEPLIVNPLITTGFYIYDSLEKTIMVNMNGVININKPPVGIYKFKIKYENNSYVEMIDFSITIRPNISYESNITLNYGTCQIKPIKVIPYGGEFSITNIIKGITINNLGEITINNVLPNDYNITIDYIMNNVKKSYTITLNIKPIILLNINELIIKYNKGFITDQLFIRPHGGKLEVNSPQIFLDFSKFEIAKNKQVGNYNIRLKYTLNKQITYCPCQLIIEPEFYYDINNININYHDLFTSNKPFINPTGGLFNLVDQLEGISIDNNTGILSFKNISLGTKTIKINYTFNRIIVTTSYIINSLPVFYYTNNNLTITYNDDYTIESEEPKIFPLGGKFILENKLVKIDTKTGIITFTNLTVNHYNFIITYYINGQKYYTNYILNIIPYLFYDEQYITVSWNCNYKSTQPIIKPSGGLFSINNPINGIGIDKYTGIITIYKLNDKIKIGKFNQIIKQISDVGLYNLDIHYTLNNTVIKSTITINIINS